MKKITVSVLSATLMLFMVFSTSAFAADEDTATTQSIGVQYVTHIQNKGWETDWKTNGALSGTTGESLRLEALKIELTGAYPADANIQTYVHVQNKGDIGPFDMGKLSGTEGEGLRLESIKLVLNNLPGYVLKYNVQVQNKGWLKDENDNTNWFVGGDAAGTAGQGLRLEGIKIVLIQTSDLTKYNTALAAITESDYQTESWAAYQTVVAANVVTMANSQTEIDNATAAITAAQSSLVKKGDLSVYNDTLATAKEADYTAVTWAAYKTVVDANIVTEANTQDKINAATIAIISAQKKLVKVADMTAYQAALAAVSQENVISGWNAYKTVLDAYVMTNQNTQAEIDTATAAILTAQKNLTFYADMAAFDKAIALYVEYGADANDAPYTTTTWDAYVAKCETYGTLKNGAWGYDVISKTSDQDKVDVAAEDINQAVLKLATAANLMKMNAAKALKITDGPYALTSYNTYIKDIRVTTITDISTATLKGYSQALVDGYTNTLLALQNEILKIGSDVTSYDEVLTQVKEADYTTASWTIYKAVLVANEVTSDNTQAEVAEAVENISTAQKSLICTAAYVLDNVNINTAAFEIQNVNDNIVTQATALLTAAGFDTADYTVTFTRVDTGGTAVINKSTGLITNIGNGTATVKFIITPVDSTVAATTANVVLVLK